ncbi:MAG: shikimate kinase [Bryobacterales bacterium]|nr:shikimate kinase [Bryobacterales bacterium]
MPKAIFLVGFMGSGKTTVGRVLSERLGWDFVDLDDDIEARAGESIPAIFETRGETAFRQAEHDALATRAAQARDGHAMVVALGGGAFAEPRNVNLIEGAGVSIWLDVTLDRAMARAAPSNHRPLARDPEKFAELFACRRAAYAAATFRIPIESDDPEVTAGAILALPVFQ